MKPETTKKVAKKATKKTTKKVTKKVTKKTITKEASKKQPKKVKTIRVFSFTWEPVKISPKQQTKLLSLQREIAEFVLPKLHYLRQNCVYHPFNLTYSEWLGILDKMIFGMQFVLADKLDPKSEEYKDMEVQAIEGQVLFGKYFSLLF